MSYGLAAAGALPALAAMWYFDKLDAARPEPRSSLRRVTLAGALSTLPIIVIELLLQKAAPAWSAPGAILWEAYIVAAATEELGKVLCVRLFIWNRPEFDERVDGIVYATRAGLGFALVENVLYLLAPRSIDQFVVMFVGRAILAVPMHAICAGMMGYYAARRRFDGVGPGLVGGYLIAVFLHGSYDAAVFGVPLASAVRPALVIPLAVTPILIVILGGLTLRRMARAALAADNLAMSAQVAAAPPPFGPQI